MGPLRTRTLLFSAALLTTLTAHLSAHQIEPSTPTSASSPDSCLHRSIPLTILPRGQQPPVELKQVQVFVNGNQVPSTAPTAYSGPLRVLLLIDTSGSMAPPKGGGGWGIGLQTAAFATDAVPPGAAVAVGTFAAKLQTSEWGDRDSARTQVLQLKDHEPNGYTALYSGISVASKRFVKEQFGDVIYLVTDGGDNRSAVNLTRLADDLLSRGIRVFVFLVDIGHEPKTSEEREGPQDMEELAARTGGLFIRIPWSKEWVSSGAAASQAKQIQHAGASPFQFAFQIPSPLSKPAKLTLETSLDPKRYTISYPRRLEPCTASSPK